MQESGGGAQPVITGFGEMQGLLGGIGKSSTITVSSRLRAPGRLSGLPVSARSASRKRGAHREDAGVVHELPAQVERDGEKADVGLFLPSSERWILQLTLRGSKRRPRVRTYTIRRFRPESLAFDIEISLHESDGSQRPAAPGTRWARVIEPGAKVAFLDEGYSYAPAPGAAWQLLVGDESALPAVLAILERSADTLPAEIFLEVPAREDIRDDVTVPPGTTIHWLPRRDPCAKPGVLALQAVRQAQLPDGRFYAWTAGESSLATGIRRHLVGERQIPKSDISFRGYFSHGRASL